MSVWTLNVVSNLPHLVIDTRDWRSSMFVDCLPSLGGWSDTEVKLQKHYSGMLGRVRMGQLVSFDNGKVYLIDDDYFRNLRIGLSDYKYHDNLSREYSCPVYNWSRVNTPRFQSLLQPIVSEKYVTEIKRIFLDSNIIQYLLSKVQTPEDLFEIEFDFWEFCRIISLNIKNVDSIKWDRDVIFCLCQSCKFCEKRSDLITYIYDETEHLYITGRDNGKSPNDIIPFPLKFKGDTVLSVFVKSKHLIDQPALNLIFDYLIKSDMIDYFTIMYLTKKKPMHEHVSLYKNVFIKVETSRGVVALHPLIIEDMVVMINIIRRLFNSTLQHKVCELMSPVELRHPFQPYMHLVEQNSKRFSILCDLYAIWFSISTKCKLPNYLYGRLSLLHSEGKVDDRHIWMLLTDKDEVNHMMDDSVKFMKSCLFGKLFRKTGLSSFIPMMKDSVGLEMMSKLPSYVIHVIEHPRGVCLRDGIQDDSSVKVPDVDNNNMVNDSSVEIPAVEGSWFERSKEILNGNNNGYLLDTSFPVADEL